MRLVLAFAFLSLPACATDDHDDDVSETDELLVCESRETRYPDEWNATVFDDGGTCCGADARLVVNVCTQLGSNDACVSYEDVCVQLCARRRLQDRSVCATSQLVGYRT